MVTATATTVATDGRNDTPNAAARFEPPNSLVVDACPFCRRRHVHGALAPTPGSQPSPDAYGYRTAHCHPTTGPASYRLVPARGEA
ncbi:MAG: hypothetical protein FWJ90_17945 [Actinomadura sp.]